eukprot:1159130-Pelagomonas_calceolata.AAC.10
MMIPHRLEVSRLAAPACKHALYVHTDKAGTRQNRHTCTQGKVMLQLKTSGWAQGDTSSSSSRRGSSMKCRRTEEVSRALDSCFQLNSRTRRYRSTTAPAASPATDSSISSAETSMPAPLAASNGVLEVREGDVHVVWTFTDKVSAHAQPAVQKSVSLWQLFRERFLPPEELAELGGPPQEGSGHSAKPIANSSMQQQAQQKPSVQHHHHYHHHHQQQQQQQWPQPPQREQVHAGDESGEDAMSWSHHDERMLARALTRSTLAAAINGACSIPPHPAHPIGCPDWSSGRWLRHDL